MVVHVAIKFSLKFLEVRGELQIPPVWVVGLFYDLDAMRMMRQKAFLFRP